MLDARLRRLIGPALDRLGGGLARSGITADALTWTGFGAGLSAIALVAGEYYGAGLLAFLLNRLLDGLDGAVARRRGITDLGGYLDITLDFVIYAGFVLGFALAQPAENGLAAAFLLFSFMGTASTFLAFAAIAARRGLASERYGPKAIYYLGGLTEGTETILAFGLFCLLPAHFATLAVLFGALCCVTAASRVYMGYLAFREPR